MGDVNCSLNCTYMFVLNVHLWLLTVNLLAYCFQTMCTFMDTKSCTKKHQTHSFTVIFTTQTGPYPVHFSLSILTALENTSCLVIHTLHFLSNVFHPCLATSGSWYLLICYFEVTSTKQLFEFFAWWSLVRCCAVARVLLCRCQALLSGC